MAEGKLSEFQRKKILRVFRIMYDNNKDGVIGLEDFQLAIEKICNSLHWTKDGDQYKKARETLYLIWEGLKSYADENKDDKVSKDEWCKMWEDCIESMGSGRGFPEWQQKFMAFMFEVNDTSGDNMIDEKEYTSVWHDLYGIDKNECKEAFKKISGGTNISREEYEKLWTEYFLSNDSTAKGNFLFGVPDFI